MLILTSLEDTLLDIEMVENLWLNKLLVSLYFVSAFFAHDVLIDDDGATATLDSVESSRVLLVIPRPSKTK